MRFKIYGKFEIPLEKNASNRIDPADVKAFWQQVEQEKPDLPNACGVYIFGIEGRLKKKAVKLLCPGTLEKRKNRRSNKSVLPITNLLNS